VLQPELLLIFSSHKEIHEIAGILYIQQAVFYWPWTIFPIQLVYVHFFPLNSFVFSCNFLSHLQMPRPVTLLMLNFNNLHWACSILFFLLLQLLLKGQVRRNLYYWIRWKCKETCLFIFYTWFCLRDCLFNMDV